jgi:hypothetical protein
MSGGTHNSVRPPPPRTPRPSSLRFPGGLAAPWRRVQSGRAMERRIFSNRGPQAGADSEEAADGRKCDGGAVGVRVGSGTSYRARCGGGAAGGAGGKRYTVPRVSRVRVRWDPSSIRFPRGAELRRCGMLVNHKRVARTSIHLRLISKSSADGEFL